MYAGTGYARSSPSGTNAYHIHAHGNTQFIHAKPHSLCKNTNTEQGYKHALCKSTVTHITHKGTPPT